MFDWMLTGFSAQTLLLLFVIAAIALIVLYILKSRAETVEVPHIGLWQQVLREERASSWWQRWKRWFSLLILLLIATAIIVALGDPMDESALERGGSVVLVLDRSGSMRALDGGENQSRFERAKSLARRAIEQLDAKDEAALVISDNSATTVVPFTREHPRLRASLDDLSPSDLSGDATRGVEQAQAMLRDRTDGRIQVYTDRALPQSEGATDTAVVDAAVIGRDSENLAINAFQLRRYPLSPSNFEALIRVTNTDETARSAQISIRADGELVSTFREDLAANSTEPIIYQDLPDAGTRWTATIESTEADFEDVHPADDVGYATLTDRSEIHLLLVTDGNLYLEAPLLLNESVRSERMSWEDFEGVTPDQLDVYDAYIFDGAAPDFEPNIDGDIVLFPDKDRSDEQATIGDPIIDRMSESHRIMRGIPTLRDVNIARASLLSTEPGDQVVARAIGGEPMIIARRTRSGSVVEFAFHPAESDLPLRVAFPLMLANIADWFRLSGGDLRSSYPPGETLRIAVPETVTEWEVRYDPVFPGISPESWMAEQRVLSQQTRSSEGMVLLRPTQIGFYTLQDAEHSVPIALGAMPESESHVSVDAELQEDRTEEVRADNSSERNQPIWTQLLIAALALLFFEWITWTRRLTV